MIGTLVTIGMISGVFTGLAKVAGFRDGNRKQRNLYFTAIGITFLAFGLAAILEFGGN